YGLRQHYRANYRHRTRRTHPGCGRTAMGYALDSRNRRQPGCGTPDPGVDCLRQPGPDQLMSGGPGDASTKNPAQGRVFTICGGYALIRTGDPIIMSDVL